MAAPDPLAGTPGEFTLSDWKEAFRSSSPHGPAMFSKKNGEAGRVGYVPEAKSVGAMRFSLGYAAVSAGPVFTLQRTPPVFHPKYPRLICTSASDEEFAPDPTGRSVKKAAEGAVNAARTLGNRGRYKKSRVTLRFSPVKYPILADDAIPNRQEWRRWCWIDQEPRTEVLSLSGFQMRYIEGTGLAAPSSSPLLQPYPAEAGAVIIKSDLRVVWEDVPEDYVMAVGTVFPFNILSGLGKVNSANWQNFFKGTLLLNGVKFTRDPWALALGTESAFSYTIEFLMSFFDPPKGFTGNPPVSLTRVDPVTGEPTDPRGHNCFPWRGNFTAGDINAGRWFAASFTGDPGDKRMYDSFNFDKLFDCPRNP